jgi:hypothetical protein
MNYQEDCLFLVDRNEDLKKITSIYSTNNDLIIYICSTL